MKEFTDKKLYLLISIILVVLIAAFFVFSSLSSSIGYNQAAYAELAQKAEAVIKTQNDEKLTIIIDPGHGGEDPGAVANDTIEKELNLSVAQKVYDFLTIAGYNVVMTRTEDVLLYEPGQESKKKFYDLRNRLDFSTKYENSIFVSIHMNKYPVEKYFGLQTFYSDNNEKSRLLAEQIQSTSKILDQENTRVIKPDNNYVFILEHIQIPAILIECGFLSNAAEAKKLSDNDYQNKLAYIIYCGIEKHLGE